MFVLGVTGPTGAGKGTACAYLAERGFFHIDTDRLVPSVYPQALPELIEAFGPQIASNGTVDRKELAKAAFSSLENTEKLNRIMHPRIMAEVARQIESAAKSGFTRVAVDGAALYEAKAEETCDKILCILAPKEERRMRIVTRDRISEDRADLRIEAQKSDEYYTSKADGVIINQSKEELKTDLDHILKEWTL